MLKRIFILLICLIACLACSLPASASEYHEDPETASVIFSGIYLLQYYSDSLDPVLDKNPVRTETLLEAIPFTNIPDKLIPTTANFASSSIALANSIAELFQIWDKQNALVRQYRLVEAVELSSVINEILSKARSELAQLKLAAEDIGAFLKVNPAASGNQLTRTYNELMEKIKRLEEMLDLVSRPVLPSEGLKDSLNPTNLSLEINPLTAFVGDEVSFSGILSSPAEPLAGRKIDILLESTQYLTVTTDSQGYFQGKLQVPYWYQPEMDVQAIYYPQEKDIGHYLGSSSPVVALTVLYYDTPLTLQAAGPAYPGREAAIRGSFFYGQAPPIERIGSELYLDDVLITRFTAAQSFTQYVPIDKDAALAGHTVTIAVPAEGRYAPVNAGCQLDIIRAVTILDFAVPAISLVPGNLEINGKLVSALGPLAGALIRLKVTGTQVQVTSSPEGYFKTELQMGPALSLFGSQVINIQVQPQEPWNAPLSVNRNIFIINILNCGLLLVLLVFAGLYLPRRSKKWFRGFAIRNASLPETISPPAVPVYETQPSINAASTITAAEFGSAGSIFDLYRLILKMVQTITRVVLKPEQTLREYARENSSSLGALSKHFIEFTLLVERFLYSTQEPADKDIERGKQLSQAIRGGQK